MLLLSLDSRVARLAGTACWLVVGGDARSPARNLAMSEVLARSRSLYPGLPASARSDALDQWLDPNV
jgi:hypothetical protein